MEQLPIASDALNYEDIISRIKDIYSVSSPQEQQYFINILIAMEVILLTNLLKDLRKLHITNLLLDTMISYNKTF